MRLFGLIGYPLGHSFSKKYFSDKFLLEGLPGCEYRNFEIPSVDHLAALIDHTPFLTGLNVTIPYKEKVIPLLHEKNEVVEKTGACNCIRIIDGRLYGYNTDVIGFEKSLKRKLLPHHTKALVLGTGGSSKAISYVMDKLEIEHLLISRGKVSEKALSYEDITDSILEDYTLIINTTPVGMFPDIDAAPLIDYEKLTPRHYLFDLIYNPEKTSFLRKGELRGATVQNGYEMLLIQAEESWKIWNSPAESKDQMLQILS